MMALAARYSMDGPWTSLKQEISVATKATGALPLYNGLVL